MDWSLREGPCALCLRSFVRSQQTIWGGGAEGSRVKMFTLFFRAFVHP